MKGKPVTDTESIGERIREEREWCGFTRTYVAQALGVTEVIVGAFEDGTAMPTADQRAQLHLLLGLAPGRLAGRPLVEDLPPGTIACGPGPVTHEDRYQVARFAEFLRYSSSAARKEAFDG